MSTFNTTRFSNYAKFDLTINKNFYRNMALVLIATIVGVAIISFFMRWLTYQISAPASIYQDLTLTSVAVLIIIEYSFFISAGCTLHPLRNKQGRITNLTIPATNLEKYLWHILICIGGCAATAVVAVALADLVNYLMSIIVFKDGQTVESLFVGVFSNTFSTALQNFTNQMHASMNGVTISDPTYVAPQDTSLMPVLNATYFSTWCSIFFTTAIYAFGNSLKYKFNLPLTYIILQVIGFCVAIVIFIVMIYLTSNINMMDGLSEDMKSFFENFHIYLYIYGSLALIAGTGLWVWAYNRYTKAQLCNKLNK